MRAVKLGLIRGSRTCALGILQFLRVPLCAAGALACSLALPLGAAQAQDKTYVMKVGLPTINDAPHQFAKDFAALVEKDSGGRIKGEVYPASQLGSIPRQIEGMQFGSHPGVRRFRRSSLSASTSASR